VSRAREARTFAFDTLIVLVTQGIMKLRALATLPLIVKLLGTENYGIWSQTLTFASVASALFLFNLHLPLVRRVAADPQDAARSYSSILILSAAIYVILTSAIVAASRPLSSLVMGQPGLDRFIFIALLLVLAGNVRTINTNLYRATGRFWIRSVVDLVATFGGLAIMILLLLRGASMMRVLSALVVWEILAAVITTAHCFRVTGVAAPSYAIMKEAVIYCLPLLSSGLAVTLLDRADRFFISNSLSIRAVGVYSATYTLASAMLLFQAPLQFTLFPKIASLWVKDKAVAQTYLGIAIHLFLLFAIPCVVGTPILASRLLRFLGNAETGSASRATVFFLSLGVLLWGISLCTAIVLYAAKKTATFAAIITVGAAVNIAACALLVPPAGLQGAAAATFVSYAVTCAAMNRAAHRELPLVWHRGFLVKCVAAAMAMGAVLLWWSPHSARSLIASMVCGGVLYFAALIAMRALTPAHLEKAKAILRGQGRAVAGT
jgi:O-antigen/teichoic acid export membrane protein